MTKKNDQKPEEKQQEQPAEQEPVRPMAVPEPTAEERIALMESRLADVERWITKHNRYHFGGST